MTTNHFDGSELIGFDPESTRVAPYCQARRVTNGGMRGEVLASMRATVLTISRLGSAGLASGAEIDGLRGAHSLTLH